MPLFIGLGAAGAGLLKSQLIDQPAYERKKQLASQTQRFSPWTGMKAEAPNAPNPFADAVTYGSQGAMMGQGLQNAQAQNKLLGAQADWMKGNPWNSSLNSTVSGMGSAGNLA